MFENIGAATETVPKTVDGSSELLKAATQATNHTSQPARYLGYTELTVGTLALDVDPHIDGSTVTNEQWTACQNLRLPKCVFLWNGP